MVHDRQRLPTGDDSETTTGRDGSRMGRRTVLKLTGSALGGLAFAGSASAASSGGKIAIDYDDYSSPDEVYNVNDNRSGISPDFVSSPVYEGDQALRLRYASGQPKAANVEYRFPEHGHGMPREMYTSFRIYPKMSNLNPDTTVRIFWLPLTNGSGSSGGRCTDGTNGFSNAIGFANRNGSPASEDGYKFFSYCYHLDRPGGRCASGDFQMTDEVVWTNEWNRIEGYFRCNTWDGSTPNADGVMRYWVNGNLAFEQTNLRVTVSDDNLIQGTGPLGYVLYDDPGGWEQIYDEHYVVTGSDARGLGGGGGNGSGGNGGTDDSDHGTTSDANSLRIVAAEDSGGAFGYEFTATGPVERVTGAGRNSAEGNDDISDNGDGTYSVAGVTGSGFGDSYSVQGEVTAFQADTDAANYTLLWNGTEVAADELLPDSANTLGIVAAEDSGGAFGYEFTATGPVEHLTDAGRNAAEASNDAITDNGDGTYTASGVTGSGFGDSYSVDGEIATFAADTDAANYTLLWNGSEVAEATFEGDAENTLAVVAAEDSGGAFGYEFTAHGPVEHLTDAGRNSAEASNDAITDNGDGSFTVWGATGSGHGDTYRVVGEVSAFDASTDAANYSLVWNGSEVEEDTLVGQ